jgi:signal transduction histidine kinase
LSVSPVHPGYGTGAKDGFVITFRDISQEKMLEQQKDEFISVASHELRTPVAIAEGSISNAILIADRDKTTDPIKHALTAAHDQIAFLSNLINDLALLSRAENKGDAVKIEAFNPVQLLIDISHEQEPFALKKKLTIKTSWANSPATINSNKLYVHEILQNFIANAIKYSDKGEVSVSAVPRTDGIVFNVSDNGIGISLADQAKIFEKFFRSSDYRVRELAGTGLGLYVSARLAELIGGKIELHSELEHGSTFSLFVPNGTKTA